MIAPIYRFAEGKQNILHTITAGTQVGAECHRQHRYVKTSYCLSEPIAAVESPHSLPACPESIKYVPYRNSPSFCIAVRKTSPPETERQQILSKASGCRYKPKAWPTSSRILSPRFGQNLVSDNRTPRTISMHRQRSLSHRQICNRFYNLFSEEKNIPKPDCPPPQPRRYRRNNHILLYTDIQALQPSCSSPVSRGTIPAASSNRLLASTKNPSRQLERSGPRTICQNEHTAKNTFSGLPKERKQRHNSVAFILTVPESPLHRTNAVVFRHSVRTIFWEV